MKKRTKKGFTLIELIVVITILAVLAIIAIPVVTQWVGEANESAADANARTLELALKATMTSEGEDDVDNITTSAAMTAFGLDDNMLTNNGEYQLVVSNDGSVVGTVGGTGTIQW